MLVKLLCIRLANYDVHNGLIANEHTNYCNHDHEGFVGCACLFLSICLHSLFHAKQGCKSEAIAFRACVGCFSTIYRLIKRIIPIMG